MRMPVGPGGGHYLVLGGIGCAAVAFLSWRAGNDPFVSFAFGYFGVVAAALVVNCLEYCDAPGFVNAACNRSIFGLRERCGSCGALRKRHGMAP